VQEVGTGSGYQAAIRSKLVKSVLSIERVEELARESSRRLAELGFANVSVVTGDGTLGHPEEAPYDAIMVTAGAPHVPAALRQQLDDGGALVIPVGSRFLQQLEVIRRTRDRFVTTSADGCVFVPLIGRDGWKE
jgi:protein-L-isoaspartate(D-aspartate) O-methyltransferase